jgi:hypothetical protein
MSESSSEPSFHTVSGNAAGGGSESDSALSLSQLPTHPVGDREVSSSESDGGMSLGDLVAMAAPEDPMEADLAALAAVSHPVRDVAASESDPDSADLEGSDARSSSAEELGALMQPPPVVPKPTFMPMAPRSIAIEDAPIVERPQTNLFRLAASSKPTLGRPRVPSATAQQHLYTSLYSRTERDNLPADRLRSQSLRQSAAAKPPAKRQRT